MKKIEEIKKREEEKEEVEKVGGESVEEAKREKGEREERGVDDAIMEVLRGSIFDENPWMERKVQDALLRKVEERKGNEISLERVLMQKRLRMVVPIIPELEVEYQSVLGAEDLIIKEKMREYADQLEIYFGTLQLFYMLSVGVCRINGVELPGGVKEGPYTWEEIEKRKEYLVGYPVDLLQALSGGFSIFQRRLGGFLSPKRLIEKIKNG